MVKKTRVNGTIVIICIIILYYYHLTVDMYMYKICVFVSVPSHTYLDSEGMLLTDTM